MAASMAAMVSSTSVLGSMKLAGASNTNFNTRTWSVVKAPVSVGRRGGIRCEAGDNDGYQGLKEKAANTQEKVQQNLPIEKLPAEIGNTDDSDIGGAYRAVKAAVNKATKTNITREMVEQNQAQNVSEQQSVFGTKPSSGAPYPRPEIERRPETGSTDIGSIFAFDGAGPETMNGRLAMVGLVWAFFAETASGLTVFEQLYTAAGGFGLVNFFAVVQVITFATLIPFLNGESTDARSFGFFTAKAERWNGRLAMLGFLSLLLTEQYLHIPVLANILSFGQASLPN